MSSIQTSAAELRDLLVSWAEINSGSSNSEGLSRMCSALRTEFGRLPGAAAEVVPLGPGLPQALRVRARPEAPLHVLLCGHFDTVYGPEDPFQRCRFPDPHTLNGPGVADMKGGLVVMLAALRAFEASEQSCRLGWEVLLTPDEEIGSAGSAPLFAEAARRHRLALVFEPARANGDLVRGRMGTGIFTATARGRAAHAGRDPKAGRNAILALAEFLPLTEGIKGDLMINVGSIRGGGAVNIVPDFAQAEINVRVTRREDQDSVLERLRERAAPINAREGFSLQIEGRFNRPPKEITPVEERLFEAWRDCGREAGAHFSWQDVAGGSDGNLLAAAGLPCLDGLGVVGDHLHSPREVIRVSSFAERAQVAALFLSRLERGVIPL